MEAIFVYLPLTNPTTGQTFNYWVNLLTIELISDANAPTYGLTFVSGATYNVTLSSEDEFDKYFKELLTGT